MVRARSVRPQIAALTHGMPPARRGRWQKLHSRMRPMSAIRARLTLRLGPRPWPTRLRHHHPCLAGGLRPVLDDDLHIAAEKYEEPHQPIEREAG